MTAPDKPAFADGRTLIGPMINMTHNPAVAMIAKHAGADFLMADMEHGAQTFDSVIRIFTVCRAAGLMGLVRVPELSRAGVSKALDSGAEGVMVPMIESREQAERFVGWAKYPPLGARGLGSLGGHTAWRKTTDMPAFMESANAGTLAIAQIETVKGLAALDEIAAVDGVDVLLVGPLDMSVSLGCPGEVEGPQVQEAIGRVASAAAKHGKIFGMCSGTSLLAKWIPHGLRLMVSGLDSDLLTTGIKAVCDDLRSVPPGLA